MKELQDTQNEFDPRGVPIDRVGVRGVRFPVQVRDKNRGLQHTVATISLAVDLPHHYKGTHMSRFLEVLQAHGPELDVKRIRAIPRELLKRLEARRAHIEFDFPYFMEKEAPATGARGLMDYGVNFVLESTDTETDFILSVRVPVACPCRAAKMFR